MFYYFDAGYWTDITNNRTQIIFLLYKFEHAQQNVTYKVDTIMGGKHKLLQTEILY